MAYYVLNDDKRSNELNEALFIIENNFEIGNIMSWCDGQLITESITDKIQIDYKPLRGFKGAPVDLWCLGLPLISVRFAIALKEAGVDNLQLFPAILTNSKTNETYDYYVFNVVGLVAATNFKKSEFESYDGRLIGDTSFHSLSIDEKKTLGLLLFRLAENFNAILIHERVRDYAVSKGIPEQRFIKPEEWSQL